MKIKICILFILVTILSSKVFSQNHETRSSLDKNVKIYPPRNNTLYIGRGNLTAIGYKVDTFKNILVTVSQGTVSSIDKYLHYIDLFKKGKVLISVYNIADKKKVLLNRATFYVDSAIITKEEKAINKLSEYCQLSVEGFSGVKVPFSVIQKATKFEVNPPYFIKSMTVYLGGGTGFTDPWVHQLNSGSFDSTFILAWKRLLPTSIITLDNIILVDTSYKTYNINGKSFVVIKN